jgi:hypothetical protein
METMNLTGGSCPSSSTLTKDWKQKEGVAEKRDAVRLSPAPGGENARSMQTKIQSCKVTIRVGKGN